VSACLSVTITELFVHYNSHYQGMPSIVTAIYEILYNEREISTEVEVDC